MITKPQPASVTTRTNLINLRVLAQKPRTHLRNTRGNTLGSTTPVQSEEPAKRRSRQLNLPVEEPVMPATLSSKRIPLIQPNIITEDAINLITEKYTMARTTKYGR